jgi:chemotaxis protein methyltransferase CheR
VRGSLDSADIERFRSFAAQRFGLHFDDSKQDFLTDVLRRRMEANGCDRFSLYNERISSPVHGPEEMKAVAEHLTVCETYFFRYADHFRAFTETVLPDRIRAREHCRQLRIVSAGCASGEEAYSIAILIRDRLPEFASWNITIHGIDVNGTMLTRALRGRYTTWSLRDTPADLRTKYFRADGRDFVLDDTVKSAVTFEERNLIEEDHLFWQRDAFDIVFCRNVTMYFTPEASRSVINRIAESLTPGGFLFLGHAETLRGISQEFHLRHTHDTFYYQQREGREPLCTVVLPRDSVREESAESPIPSMIESSNSWFSAIQRASERIVNLTEQRNRPAMSGTGSVATLAPSAPLPLPMSAWDRTAAIELMREERFSEATELLRALPPELKMDPDAQLLLAALLTNGGDLPEAEKLCQCLLDLDELNSGAHYLMALCREHAGDRDAALEHDRAAVYIDSVFAMPHLHIGLVAKRSADVETAKREFGNALALLAREDASRILLFGGGFTRETLVEFCRAELRACGGSS